MNYKQFIDYIAFTANAHQEYVLPKAKSLRTLPNGDKIPYFTHSLWCAMMIYLEPNLPENIREIGAETLLFHDVLEDTSSTLPDNTSDEVRYLVQEMTYQGGFNEEKYAVLEKPPIVQLLKLYDKTATLYDGDLKPTRHKEWIEFMEKLIVTVENEYGTLNIVLLAKSLIKKYKP